MFDGCESKEVGHQNRYGCSSPASAASAIAALQTGRRGAVTAHGNGACHQAESLWTGLRGPCVVLLHHQAFLVSPDSLVLLAGWAGAVCRTAGMHGAGALLSCSGC